ncbi:MAG: acylphosphatase [Acidimicrobiia bacterium]
MASANERIRRRVRVTGRVQGVGFRESCRREAQRLGVAGTVSNRGDGSVEAVFEGAALVVDQMVAWCRRGPRSAHVRDVTVTLEGPIDEVGFTISF